MEFGLTRASLVCFRTDRLTVAPHPRITPDARTVEARRSRRGFSRKQDTKSGDALRFLQHLSGKRFFEIQKIRCTCATNGDR